MPNYRIIKPLRSRTDRGRPVAKLHLLVPKGYRLLSPNVHTKQGDFFWFAAYNRWEPVLLNANTVSNDITIRPVAKQKLKAMVAKVDPDVVPRPPRGYRLLKKGAEICGGDLYWSTANRAWCLSGMAGVRVGYVSYCRKK